MTRPIEFRDSSEDCKVSADALWGIYAVSTSPKSILNEPDSILPLMRVVTPIDADSNEAVAVHYEITISPGFDMNVTDHE